MSKFKVGDRVVVYDKDRILAIVDVVGPDLVFYRSKTTIGSAHHKQCRRLKPKAKAPRGKVGRRALYIDVVDLMTIPPANGADEKEMLVRLRRSSLRLIKFIEAEDQS